MQRLQFKIIVFVCLLFYCLSANAQFTGGPGDGQVKSGVTASTLNGLQLNNAPLFLGGNGDGATKLNTIATLSGQPLSALFGGGNGDGFDKETFNGVIDGQSLTGLFGGGLGDGFNKASFNGVIDGSSLAGLFGGGIGDGFDKDQFNGTIDGTLLAGLFGGGIGDGFDKDQFNGVIDGSSLAGLFGGGMGDGFDKDQFNGVIDGTQLSALFGGGIGDGFDKTSFSGPMSVMVPDPPLPVELLSFNAFKDGQDVRIEWQTAIEVDNDYFIVQRSPNTENVEDLELVPGKGNGSGHRYATMDYDPFPAISYYRLKQVDLDGRFTLSDWKAVRFDELQELSFTLTPNPSSDGIGLITISLPENVTEVQVEIYDPVGRQVNLIRRASNASSTVVIPIAAKQAISGTYLVRVNAQDYIGIKKWVIVRP